MVGVDSEDEFGPMPSASSTVNGMYVGDVPPWPGQAPGLPVYRQFGQPPQPTVQVDYMKFVEEAKAMERFRVLRQVLEAAESVETTESRGRDSYGSRSRTPENVKKEIVDLIKAAMT